jgi:RNA polymerase sigma-54 factor
VISNSLLQKLQQKLSPQQIQLMKLLSLPNFALEQRIKEELENNPTLEEDEVSSKEENEIEDTSIEERQEKEDDVFDNNEMFPDDDEKIFANHSSNNYENIDKDGLFIAPTSFYEDLINQLQLQNLSQRDHLIGLEIIGNIDDSGYLSRSIVSIVDDFFFRYNLEVDKKEIEKILNIIQGFDPCGVGARDLKECLLIQLKREKQTEDVLLATKIIKRYFEYFKKKQYNIITQKLGCSEKEISQAIEQIIKLNPKPGNSRLEIGIQEQAIVPDFIIWQTNSKVFFRLNNYREKNLKTNSYYENLLKKVSSGNTPSDKQATVYLKERIDSANGFIDALNKRKETLETIMQAIIDYQYDYFLEGDIQKLKPMRLVDIANKVNLDISTISRVVSNKYAQTHFGIILLKDCFSNFLLDEQGEKISTDKIKDELEKIIEGEDKNSPYTDEQLVEILKSKGFPIARRTVSKYREMSNIPIARLRKGFFLALFLFIFNFISFGQKNVEIDNRSVNRRIADSLFLLYNPPANDIIHQEQEDDATAIFSVFEDAPCNTLYNNTWCTNKVKMPSFSFGEFPDFFSISLIDEKNDRHFHFPCNNAQKSSSYGMRWGRKHGGVDFSLKVGEPIYAAFDGVVRVAQKNGGYGNMVLIRHYNNLETLYGHLDKINVKVGDRIKAGDIIGLSGNTGFSTGPHLHFECRCLYQSFDPEIIIDVENRCLKQKNLNIDRDLFSIIHGKERERKINISSLSKVDKTFEGKPYVSINELLKDKKTTNKKEVVIIDNEDKSSWRYWKVRKEDTILKLADKFNITPQQIIQMNDLKGESLEVGKRIRVR